MNDALSVLRDPAARSMLTVLGLIVAVLSFFLGQWWWKRKALSYAVSQTPILEVHRTAQGRVQITFEGARVEDVSLVIITISNSGHESIKAEDFIKPIRISFGKNAWLLSCEAVNARPSGLDPQVNYERTGAFVEPLLLNRRDSFEVKALVSRMGKVALDGRIIGVKEIKKASTDMLFGVTILSGVVLLSLALFLTMNDSDPTAAKLFRSLVTSLNFGLLIYMIKGRRYWWR